MAVVAWTRQYRPATDGANGGSRMDAARQYRTVLIYPGMIEEVDQYGELQVMSESSLLLFRFEEGYMREKGLYIKNTNVFLYLLQIV